MVTMHQTMIIRPCTLTWLLLIYVEADRLSEKPFPWRCV